jgi:hypothetical protein
MSIGKRLMEPLRCLATGEGDPWELSQNEDGSGTISVSELQVSAKLEFFDYDRYSVTLRALEVGDGAPVEGDAGAYLSHRAAEIARCLSYLEERLTVWELDGDERIALLRSSPPHREGDEVSYWEVTLSVGHARLMRYRWAPGMVEREAIAYPATFALVGRMADSLAEALEADDE